MAAQSEKRGAIIPHGSVLLTDLPADMKQIYTRVIRSFFKPPPAAKAQRKAGAATQKRDASHFISEATLVEEADNAVVAVEVPSKEAAQRLYKRLQNAKVCGRRWKVQYVPAAQVQPSADPCLVECLLVPGGSRDLAERALSVVPGFLAFAELPPELAPQAVRAGVDSEESASESHGTQTEKFLASFADEGCALHARAVLSGRLIGTSGVRMFLERRR